MGPSMKVSVCRETIISHPENITIERESEEEIVIDDVYLDQKRR